MLNIVSKAITKIFGSKSDRDLKEVLPYVEQINAAWQKLGSISDEELREQTHIIKNHIDDTLKEIDQQIADLQQQAEVSDDVHQKEDIFTEIDKLELERNKELEKVLLEVLPQAFAVIKETARRLKDNGKLVVKATFMDKQIAAKKSNVLIEGETATWLNQWEAAGAEITWNMVHYDVQLIGGIVLHQGKIAEMATGEGKTLVATLPAFLNALAKRGVHIVTVNDYLARRDSEWMAPLFEFHGLTVDCIDKHRPNSPERRAAYKADITYGTNNEFGFDYLRDNMADNEESLVQRKHHYTMIDEVDSVLIDEARTPLIISGPVPRGDEHEFDELKPRIAQLVSAQQKLVLSYLQEAKKMIKAGDNKNAGLPLFRAHRGMPKLKPLIKFLSEPGMKTLMQKTENYYLQDNARMMPEADEPLYFTINEKNNQIDLTDKGLKDISKSGEDANFFIMPDIGVELDKIESDDSLNMEEKNEKKSTMINDYNLKSQRIHTINQLLKAYTLFEKEVDYIVVDGKVKIVDEQTGRVMDGRRYSDGLHQALEAKENVKIENATQTYATITLQNYFRMYHKLSGMTGTAETEAGELWDIYKLDVVVIPTNVPVVRNDQNDLIYKTAREKYNAVAEEIVRLSEAGRPVLVGTTSVEISELVSRMLSIRKIKHQVLNAKLHQKEAEIVAEAGKPGTVTIATNMAGRGTDIKLTAESKEAGGLAIIGTERHESRRVDRQLRGRAGRQGDPGSSQFFVSLEDNLMRLFGSERMAKIMDRLGLKEGEVIQHSMMTKSIERAQRKVEENNFGIRKRLLEYDDVMNSQREIIYRRRRNALSGERIEVDVMTTFFDVSNDLAGTYAGSENYEDFRLEVFAVFGFDPKITPEELNNGNPNQIGEQLYIQSINAYRQKNKQLQEVTAPALKDIFEKQGENIDQIAIRLSADGQDFVVASELKTLVESGGKELIRAVEKDITLQIIDHEWKEHLRDMDDLKQSVQNAVYEQKDPILIYKFESFELFKIFLAKVNRSIVSVLAKAHLPENEAEGSTVQKASSNKRKRAPKVQENKADAGSLLGANEERGYHDPSGQREVEKVMPAKSQKTHRSNDRVSVQYSDGKVKKDVKYKTVEDDIKNNRCVLIEN